jgi:NADH-quinone oxidoreductase subunit H
MAEYIKMIAVSVIAATLFFGGYDGPFVDRLPILGPLYLFIKVILLLFGMIWIRATLPRIRYDRLMAFGWKVLLPLSLANVVVTAVLVVLLGG